MLKKNIKIKNIKKNKKNKRFFKKEKKNIYKDVFNLKNVIIFHIFSTFNNTIVTLTNRLGDTISWATSCSVGFKGFRKSTSYAAQAAAEKIGKSAIKLGFTHANIFIRGVGVGRDFAVRGIYNSGINILSISDITTIPHNGCKFKKIRRK